MSSDSRFSSLDRFFFFWHVETIPYKECCQCPFPLTVGISIPNYCRASYPVRQCSILHKFLFKDCEKNLPVVSGF